MDSRHQEKLNKGEVPSLSAPQNCWALTLYGNAVPVTGYSLITDTHRGVGPAERSENIQRTNTSSFYKDLETIATAIWRRQSHNNLGRYRCLHQGIMFHLLSLLSNKLIQKERTLKCSFSGRWESLRRRVYGQALPSVCHVMPMVD